MEKDQTITTTKTTKQQTTSTSTSRYLLPFLRITVSVAWYIYLTVLKCICNVGLKKNHQSINKLLYHTLHLHVPSPTRSPHLTSPTFSFSPYPYLPNNTFPYPLSLSLTISGLSPPTYLPTHLPYRTQVYLAFNVLLFLFLCLPCIIKYTYIHTFLSTSPAYLPLGTLPIYFSYLPAQPSSVPTCLPVLSRMLYIVCWQ